MIPTASRLPETGPRYEKIFRNLGARKATSIPFETRADAERDDLLDTLEQATGVFLTGGNQLQLSTILGGTQACTVIFKPGVHYLDVYDDSKTDPAARTTLTISNKNVQVIGGQPLAGGTFPRACDTTKKGAQLILSPRSAFRHTGGRVALCPRYVGDDAAFPFDDAAKTIRIDAGEFRVVALEHRNLVVRKSLGEGREALARTRGRVAASHEQARITRLYCRAYHAAFVSSFARANPSTINFLAVAASPQPVILAHFPGSKSL